MPRVKLTMDTSWREEEGAGGRKAELGNMQGGTSKSMPNRWELLKTPKTICQIGERCCRGDQISNKRQRVSEYHRAKSTKNIIRTVSFKIQQGKSMGGVEKVNTVITRHKRFFEIVAHHVEFLDTQGHDLIILCIQNKPFHSRGAHRHTYTLIASEV